MTYKERARKFWKGGANIEKIAELLRSVAEDEREACAKTVEEEEEEECCDACVENLCEGCDCKCHALRRLATKIRARKEKA